jgi:hypothetical protein
MLLRLLRFETADTVLKTCFVAEGPLLLVVRLVHYLSCVGTKEFEVVDR